MTKRRQLAAIMFTDIEGYTRLMQQDESKALAIREKHREVFNRITLKYKGKILQYYGDGTLSIFDSACEAVLCAIDLQLAFLEEPSIPVRIGIHSGDIIYSEEEIIGDGVNVASRIESLAVAGSVLISGKVYDEIKNQPSIKSELINTFKFKNVYKTIDVYSIANEGLTVPARSKMRRKRSGAHSGKIRGRKRASSFRISPVFTLTLLFVIAVLGGDYFFGDKLFRRSKVKTLDKSVAVLAFENMSGDPSQEYFSDGISEEILNSLVKIKGLKVAGRTSSFAHKNSDADIQEIGRKLGVSMVLEGSLRKSNNRVRITAQLINVADGYHIWSEQYDRELDDIFAIEEEIANNIADMLRLTLLGDQNNPPTRDLKAYDLYLRGVYALSRDVEGTLEALNYFKNAIELDPEFAQAYSRMGDAYLNASIYGLLPVNEAVSKSRQAARKSIELNESEANGHKVLAYLHLFYDWEWELALAEYNTAVRKGLADPDFFITLYEAILFGSCESAIANCEQILRRDPLSNEAHWHLGLCNYLAGKYPAAVEAFKGALEINPNYSEAHRLLGASYRQMGMYEESIQSLQTALQLTKGLGPANMDLLATYGASGNKEQLKAQLGRLMEFSKEHAIPSIIFAIGFAHAGDMDAAFSWLEKAYHERFLWLLSIRVAPEWDVFKSDPRFETFIDGFNFPEV